MGNFLQDLFGSKPANPKTPAADPRPPAPDRAAPPERVDPPLLTTPLADSPVSATAWTPPESAETADSGARSALPDTDSVPAVAVPDVGPASTSRDPRNAARRIYYVHAPLWGAPLGPDSIWPRELARCAALGCTHVLLSPPWQPADDGDVMTIADVDRLHPSLGGGPAAAGIEAIADLCRAAGLSLLLDLPLTEVARQGPLATAHPDWLVPAASASDRIDPRRTDVDHTRAMLDWHGGNAPLLAWAEAWIAGLAASGVAGFRAASPTGLPASAWQRLVAASRRTNARTCWLAWTPGIGADAVERLAGAGFDATFSSLPWWDERAGWLVDEATRLRRLGRLIAAPEAPFAPRLAPHRMLHAHRRALWLAAAVGDDLLLPMGYEYGATIALNPRHHTRGDWAAMRASAPFDLSADITAASAWIAARDPSPVRLRLLGAPEGTTTALLRSPVTGADAVIVALNPDLAHPASVRACHWLAELPVPARALQPVSPDGADIDPAGRIDLAPGGVQLLRVVPSTPIVVSAGLAAGSERPALAAAMRQPRIAIEAVTPQCDGGRFPVKRSVGDTVRVEADVWIDGHDQLAVQLRFREHGAGAWQTRPMRHVSNDRWVGDLPLCAIGRHVYCVDAWRDTYATWSSEVRKKRAAGIDVHLEIEEGRKLVRDASRLPASPTAVQTLAADLAPEGTAATADDDRRDVETLLSPAAAETMRHAAERPHLTQSAEYPLDAERLGARYASWYELFPRSQNPDPARHGSFDDVIAQLPRVAAMGFDVLYFPPIHPIGRAHRKGRNNSLAAGPDDPGSPYAIGSPDGGHTAIHPQLGTLDDFRRLRLAAEAHGLELALDFAIQCSPDHPWLREHPEWFMFRPDGTVKYAENPPKKYEDIVNVDFYSDRPAADGSEGAPGLWLALRDAVLFWADEGIRLFRVDNPHTKPLPFWEWLIAEVRGRHPDAVFLAEAFTRPKMMARLAKVGYSQSYSYFTWRNTKSELTEYLSELNAPPWRDVFRPHFFVNTPDINPHFLQTSGRPGFLIRAALATMLSGLWGMYNGYEVCDALPHLVDGVAKEEYGDSEKYQFRQWDWTQPGNIVAEITRLNAIRRENPALHSHLGVRFYTAHNDQVLFFAKFTEGDTTRFGDNVILVVVNLDPHHVQEADIEVPLWDWGLPDDADLRLHDLMTGTATTWHGKYQHVRLDPWQLPFAIWRAHPPHPTSHRTA